MIKGALEGVKALVLGLYEVAQRDAPARRRRKIERLQKRLHRQLKKARQATSIRSMEDRYGAAAVTSEEISRLVEEEQEDEASVRE